MAKIDYRFGEMFGMIMFLHEIDPHVTWRGDKLRKRRMGKFLCPNGHVFITRICRVKSENAKCRCMRKKSKPYNSKHGLTSHPMYIRWQLLKDRCYNKNAINYKHYGGRGITVCDEWKCNFKSFFDYMMALPDAMKEGYTIDRIENDGNYEPGNVKWSDWAEQNNNRRPRSPFYKPPPMSEESRRRVSEANMRATWWIDKEGTVTAYKSVGAASMGAGVSRGAIERSVRENKKTRYGQQFMQSPPKVEEFVG